MRTMLFFSTGLMVVKFAAYFITNSVAVLSDALESVINVMAGAFALFSIHYASRPRDTDHPYGHGKIENMSAGFEGGLILIAGISIIGKAVWGFFFPQELSDLGAGLWLAAFAGLCNFFMGRYLVKKGKEYSSMLMTADGKHLLSDTVSSIGLVAGLGFIWLTGLTWVDNVLAIFFGAAILVTGYRLIRESVTGLLDTADMAQLSKLAEILNRNRRAKWIDVHNLRILRYGSRLHIDAHLTLPWYDTLEQAHEEVGAVERIVKEGMGDEVECFIHADPCLPSSCSLCLLEQCPHRKAAFQKRVEWTPENLMPDRKHGSKGTAR